MAEVTRTVADSNAANWAESAVKDLITVVSTDNLAVPWTDAALKELSLTLSGVVTQVVLEVLTIPITNATVTQVVLEVLLSIAIPKTLTDSFDAATDAIDLELEATNLPLSLSDIVDDINVSQDAIDLSTIDFFTLSDTNVTNWDDAVSVDFVERFIEVDDTLNSWDDSADAGFPELYLDLSDTNETLWSDDAVASFPELYLDLSDTNENEWNDDVTKQGELHLTFIDNTYHFYDEAEVHTVIYVHSIIAEPTDNLNECGDSVDAISYLLDGEEILYELNDSFALVEEISLLDDLAIIIEDNLDAWQEELITMPGEFLDYAYDEMTSNWADVVEQDFKQHRSASDNFSLTDAVVTSLDAYALFRTAADSLNNWLENVIKLYRTRKVFEDYMAFNDSIGLFLTYAFKLTDTLSMQDAVSTSLNKFEVIVADILTFSDAIQTSLNDYKHTVTSVDNLNNWLEVVNLDLFRSSYHATDSLNNWIDGISVQLFESSADYSDSLQLWNELVQLEFKAKLEKTTSDTLNNWQESSSNSGTMEDLDYYRRYLNDVIQ